MDEFPIRRAIAVLLAVVLAVVVIQLMLPSPSQADCTGSRANAAIFGYPDRC